MKKGLGQKGFTLVELAIVLVIIGLLIGAVLKGQQMIDNARLKRVYNQQREIVAAVYSYYDKYGKLPGDDDNALGRWAGTTNGDSDGTIEGGIILTCAIGATTETCQAWRHARNANLITGSAASAVNPTHAYGAAIGIGYATIQTLLTNWIAFNNIPYDACQSIDLQYDDGGSTGYTTGSIRGSGNYSTATSGVFTLYFRL